MTDQPPIPEFTIETRYVPPNDDLSYEMEPDAVGTANFLAPGWRYVLRWTQDDRERATHRNGFCSETAALKAAKDRADQEARAMFPVRTTKYTPKV